MLFIIRVTYKICVNQLFMLLMRPPVNSRLSVVKFGGSQKLLWIFDRAGIMDPKPALFRDQLYRPKVRGDLTVVFECHCHGQGRAGRGTCGREQPDTGRLGGWDARRLVARVLSHQGDRKFKNSAVRCYLGSCSSMPRPVWQPVCLVLPSDHSLLR